MSDFNANENYRLSKMLPYRQNHPGKAYWHIIGPGAAANKKLMAEYDNYLAHGQRVGKSAPPETWLTRRKDYMKRRYTKTPEGGFAGALGDGSVNRKKLLGR